MDLCRYLIVPCLRQPQMNEVGKEVVHKPDDLFGQIYFLENSTLEVFWRFNRPGFREFQAGDVKAFPFETEFEVLGAGFIGKVNFSHHGTFFNCQATFFQTGIIALDGDGFFGVVAGIFKDHPVADRYGYKIRVDPVQLTPTGFDDEPQPGQKFIAQELVTVICNGNIQHRVTPLFAVSPSFAKDPVRRHG